MGLYMSIFVTVLFFWTAGCQTVSSVSRGACACAMAVIGQESCPSGAYTGTVTWFQLEVLAPTSIQKLCDQEPVFAKHTNGFGLFAQAATRMTSLHFEIPISFQFILHFEYRIV